MCCALLFTNSLEHIHKSSRAVTSTLAFISSCVNPILYTFAGKSYIKQNGFAFMAKLFEGTSSEQSGTNKSRILGENTTEQTNGGCISNTEASGAQNGNSVYK